MQSPTANLKVDPFELFDTRWGLLTAGTIDDFNAMTISWGALGTIWGVPEHRRSVATVYVKPIRHTFGYLQQHELFTIGFFPAELKQRVHSVMGSKSGRDCDKVALAGITPLAHDGTVVFEEAELTLVCRKLYAQQLDVNAMPPDVVADIYSVDPAHYMFMGDIIQVIER